MQCAINVQKLEDKNEDIGELDPSSLIETVTMLLVQVCYQNNGNLQTYSTFLFHTSLYMVEYSASVRICQVHFQSHGLYIF